MGQWDLPLLTLKLQIMRTEEQKLATKESRRIRREERKFRRINKRREKDKIYISVAWRYDRHSVSWGRRKFNGRIFTCEMNWVECEEKGYCDGDC